MRSRAIAYQMELAEPTALRDGAIPLKDEEVSTMTTATEPNDEQYLKIPQKMAIFAFCCECVGNTKDITEIRLCPSRGKCPLYAFRPFRKEGEVYGILTKEQFLSSRGYSCLNKEICRKILEKSVSKSSLLEKISQNKQRGKALARFSVKFKKKSEKAPELIVGGSSP